MVLKQLKDFSVSFDDYGKRKYIGKYSSLERIIEENDYSIRLFDERSEEYKTLVFHVSRLSLTAKNSTVETGQCNQMLEGSKECFSIIDAFDCGYSTYILKGKYTLVFDSGLNN